MSFLKHTYKYPENQEETIIRVQPGLLVLFVILISPTLLSIQGYDIAILVYAILCVLIMLGVGQITKGKKYSNRTIKNLKKEQEGDTENPDAPNIFDENNIALHNIKPQFGKYPKVYKSLMILNLILMIALPANMNMPLTNLQKITKLQNQNQKSFTQKHIELSEKSQNIGNKREFKILLKERRQITVDTPIEDYVGIITINDKAIGGTQIFIHISNEVTFTNKIYVEKKEFSTFGNKNYDLTTLKDGDIVKFSGKIQEMIKGFPMSETSDEYNGNDLFKNIKYLMIFNKIEKIG